MLLAVLIISLLNIMIIGSSAKEISKTSFSCERRPSGYYADLDTGCQVYHMCDGLGRQFSYSCPNATLFQQRMLICDHWYMVNCSKSEVDYPANLLIGQRDKPFLEDSENHPYHRTPRPDLLTNPKGPVYNLMYRNGRSQFASNFNLVGIETDRVNNNQPTYFLPSHWFTEYSNATATSGKRAEKVFHVKQNKYVKNAVDINKKNLDENSKTKLKSVINENTKFNIRNKIEDSTEAFVTQFMGHYRYQPTIVSNTTGYVSTRTHISLHARTIPSNTLVPERRRSEMQWKDLRKLFLIPDYEFPLDSAARPGYENGQSSFEVNSTSLGSYKK